MIARKRPGRSVGFWLAIACSLLLHIPVLMWLDIHLLTPSDKPHTQKRLTAQMVQYKKPKQEVAPPPPEEPEKGRIVELPPPEKEVEPPRETQNLAEKNHRVKKEQKSRDRSKSDAPPKKGKRQVQKESVVQAPQSNSIQESRLEKKPDQAANAPKVPSEQTWETGKVPQSPPRPAPPHPSLLLPATHSNLAVANVQTLSSRSSSDNLLMDVEKEGDETMLNAREFRYWHYFERIKEQVKKHWSPAAEYQKRDPSGRLYGVEDRYTRLVVTLSDRGEIEKLGVMRKSGIPFLDEEAFRAFRASGPFPNPPAGLVGEDGKISFEFGFLFEIGTGPRFFWKR